MQIINTVVALRERLASEPAISLVPTMGNLHAGHIELVKLAKQPAQNNQHTPCVVVSIFVNPLQFGANEDLASYPRTLEADCEKLKAAGADVVFAPAVSELYPNFDANTQDLGQSMTVNPPPIASELCGKVRPNHFSGVATIVLKLFNIVFFNAAHLSVPSTNTMKQNSAIFGKKDFQQLFIIHELVRQFNLPIKLVAGATKRETDGLAMSSRNAYLNATQRKEAPALHNSLMQVVANLQESGKQSSSNANELSHSAFNNAEQQATAFLQARGWVVDYISIRASNTLALAKVTDSQLVVLGAARLGITRLIDNIEFALIPG